MTSFQVYRVAIALSILGSALPLRSQELAHVIFVEPTQKLDTRAAEVSENMPTYRPVADPGKYLPWLRNQSAERALRLYRAAYEIAHPQGGTPDYYVALVPGGNHAAVGFKLQTADKVEEFPRQPYILLDASPERFEGTLLHETGHVAMSWLAGGRRLDGNQMAAIPHTTAALSDRTTAFTEGWAIHLETLAAHLQHDAGTRARYHRERIQFGDGPFSVAEYFHQSSDLATFSQTVARYLDVRENNFAFESAFQGPDYLRVQMEKARDFASLREPGQLLQSEGFYASFFFLWVMRGPAVPTEEVIAGREKQLMRAMNSMFTESKSDFSNPWLLNLIVQYMKLFPDEKTALADAINDLSHGVFVDSAAATLWRDHYLATLRIDQKNMNQQGIQAARKKWREQVLADPQILFSRLGPEIACKIPSKKVQLVALGDESEVLFDLNAVQSAIARMVPGVTDTQIAAWMSERPFSTMDDFTKRVGPLCK